MNIEQVDQDEKSTLADASHALNRNDCDSLMKGLRPPGVKSWAKEERLIALAAWLNRN